MHSIGFFVAANSALALAGAALAWMIGRWTKRPALAHAIWALALLKLVTPPLWTVDPWPAKWTSIAPTVQAKKLDHRDLLEVDGLMETVAADLESLGSNSSTPQSAPEEVATVKLDRTTTDSSLKWRRWAPIAALWVWFGGSLVVAATAVVRIARFRRSLRHATPALEEVQTRARRLARRLGAHGTCPTVWRVPGPICPLLWAGGGAPRVLVPGRLWDAMDSAQRDALLLHELAHWRRRDHWMRWLELLATIVHWWNPVCWWTRRGLRESEELCCDAWVMWARPDGFRPYARALLDALEFAAAGPGAATLRSPGPALASGMGQFGHLSRRLVMLKRTDVARRLSSGNLVAVCGLGAMLLPLAPTWAQKTETIAGRSADSAPFVAVADGRTVETAQGERGTNTAKFEEVLDLQPVKTDAAPGAAGNNAQFGIALDHPVAETEDTAAQLAKTRAELAAATAQLKEQYDRLQHVRQRLAQLERAADEQNRKLAKLDIDRDQAGLSRAKARASARPSRPEGLPGPAMTTVPDRLETPVESRAGNRIAGTRAPTAMPETLSIESKPRLDSNARLQVLEDKLNALLDEVRAVRDDSNTKTTEGPGAAIGR